MLRALASHLCVPSSFPAPGIICGLSLLLVLYSALRGFSLGPSVFPSPKKTTVIVGFSYLSLGERVKTECVIAKYYFQGTRLVITRNDKNIRKLIDTFPAN